MLNAYIVIECVVVLFIAYCLLRSGKHGSDLKKELGILLRMGIYTMFFHILYVSAGYEQIAMIGFCMFSAMIDWLLLAMLHFIFAYTMRKNQGGPHKAILTALAIADTVSMIVNILEKHVFTLKKVVILDNNVVYEMSDASVFYVLHLLYCYCLVIGIIFLLVRQYFVSSKHYRKKYSGVLLIFALVVLLDGLCVALHIAMNVSILFYGFLTIAVYYYTIHYIPAKLVSQMQTLMMDKLGNGIICFDELGKCIYYNNIMWTLWGVKPNIAKAEKKYAEFHKNKKMFDSDYKRWRDTCVINGETRFLEVSSQDMYDERHRFIACYFCFYDRTEQRKFFEKKLRQEQAANQAKTAFLSMVSHEIRTPVNSIYGMSEMILRESNEEDVLQYATQIKSASDTLIGIINDVLDFSKIDSGHMEIVEREFSLEKLIRNIYDITKIKAMEKNLIFDLVMSPNLPTTLRGDDVRIEQIMMNLLSNAVKYTPEGRVTLRLSWEEIRGKSYLCIYVRDTGIGIKQEDVPKLFEVFRRLEPDKNHGIQGTGLGLNITYRLLELMGSRLELVSEYGKGSTFYCKIPLVATDETILNFDPDGKPEIRKKEYTPSFTAPDAKILVVDDNRINRMVFRNLVKKTMVQVTEAESGEECLRLVQENHFDLIFMDHMMPEMDGVETFERLQETEHLCKGVPVIMLTANAIEGAMQDYLDKGFSDFLAKPVIPENLENMMKKYIRLETEESVE